MSFDPSLPVVQVLGSERGTSSTNRRGDFESQPVDYYRRPDEGTDASPATVQAYLDWEFGLLEQLQHDGTHGFWVLDKSNIGRPDSPVRTGV